MKKPAKNHPHWHLKFKLPIYRSPDSPCWLWTKFSVGEFGGSGTNSLYRLFIFGWAIFELERLEYDGPSTDTEKARQYWLEWHKWETRAREAELKLAMERCDPETRQHFDKSLGLKLDNDLKNN